MGELFVADHLDDEVVSEIKQAASQSSKDSDNQLLDVAAALIEKDSICAKTGLARALRELSSTIPPPADPSTWLGVRLRDYRPVDANVEYGESVLDGLVMKCDEFPGIHLLPEKRLHPEAWNFRKCDDGDSPVFGVGQCHVDGIRFLLGHLKDDLGYDKVKWFNMREEPVVFIDGQACAPRVKEKMNENVEYLVGIEGHELDAMELRLCSDCKNAGSVSENAGAFGVFWEVPGGKNEERQLPTGSEKTFSVRKGYEWLAKQEGGPAVEYYRVPVSDETAPEEKDFDQLVAELKGCLGQPNTALVFNCQMGRGRTTTGMVSCCIMAKAVRHASSKNTTASSSKRKKSVRPSLIQSMKAGTKPSNGSSNNGSNGSNGSHRNKKRGEFLCVLTLVDMIDCACECTGREAKKLVDECIDSCAHTQNMVEAIEECVENAKTADADSPRSPDFWRSRAHNYLERYAYLLLFAAYALENAKSHFRMNFTEWSRQYWHFKRVIKHLTLE